MKRLTAACLLLTLLSQPACAVETAAKQAYLIDATTHTVLLDKAGHTPMHPSSMSKLMTVYLLFAKLKEGRIKLEDRFPVSEKAWRTQGSKTFVGIGGEMTVEELIHGIIIQSGNDACIVAAEGLSGSEDAFVKEMNRVGKEMGLVNTTFTNSTGLPDDAHLMSARDLATLSERLIEDFPDYYPYFGLREYTYNNIKQQNRNRLLGRGIGVDGLKTGHTEAGGYGIALSAKQGERRLILVINGLGSDNQRAEEGDRLLRWGFREFENKAVLREGQEVGEAEVWFGRQSKVKLTAAHEVVMTLPVNTQKDTRFTLKYTGPIPAPVEKGAHVADLIIQPPEGEAQTVELLAGEPVDKLSGFSRIPAVLDYYVFNRRQPAPAP